MWERLELIGSFKVRISLTVKRGGWVPAPAAVVQRIRGSGSAGPHASEVLIHPLTHLFFVVVFFLEPGLDRKLEFLLEPVSLTKVLGATALLPCVVSGYPPPHIRWMLGDKLVEERYEPFQLLGADCPSRVRPAGPASSSHTAAAASDGATLALRLQGCGAVS